MAEDDAGDITRRSGEAGPDTQAGAVMAPPPPPPAPPATGTEPPREDRPRRRGGLVAGLVLIVIGLILLAQQYFPGLGFDRLWPLILVVIGLGMIFRRR
ncbi:MAG TPA: DUF5668 domain-containing protein [Coriobacteriia bacterium]|jgi:hypothetical protein